MGYALSLGIFFLVWWCIFLALLPIGIETREESGEVLRGMVASAPAPRALNLWRKCLWATAIAAFLTSVGELTYIFITL